MNTEKRPRITMMGEEIPWESLPDARAINFDDYFKPVKLSPRAIDSCSKIVPSEYWKLYGLHTWLSKRANHVFSKLSGGKNEAYLGTMKYFFEYDADGPVLKNVSL